MLLNLAKISLYYTYRADFQHVNLQNPLVFLALMRSNEGGFELGKLKGHRN
jgi:hypothetical protein